VYVLELSRICVGCLFVVTSGYGRAIVYVLVVKVFVYVLVVPRIPVCYTPVVLYTACAIGPESHGHRPGGECARRSEIQAQHDQPEEAGRRQRARSGGQHAQQETKARR
jgi:hypothetical protein